MSYAERAIERLYENEGLTNELTDNEAKPLLRWAESEIVRLDEAGLDEETFEAQFKLVRRVMKRINRFVARRADDTPDDNANALQRLADNLRELGHTVHTATLQATIAEQAALDNAAVVRRLLALAADDTPPQSSLSGAETHD